jgi:hypothetical protein
VFGRDGVKRLLIAASVIALGSGQAIALTCPASEGTFTAATGAEIATVLEATTNPPCVNAPSCTGKFAVLGGSGPNSNHEVIVGSATGGAVYDKKLGNIATDPAGQVGTYVISDPGTAPNGNIEYLYGGSTNFTYCVYGSAYGAGKTGSYIFFDGTNALTVILQVND